MLYNVFVDSYPHVGNRVKSCGECTGERIRRRPLPYSDCITISNLEGCSAPRTRWCPGIMGVKLLPVFDTNTKRFLPTLKSWRKTMTTKLLEALSPGKLAERKRVVRLLGGKLKVEIQGINSRCKSLCYFRELSVQEGHANG